MGLLVLAPIIALLVFAKQSMEKLGMPMVLLMSLPGALVLLGLVEAFTGVGYGQLAQKWDSMKGWQRGVLAH